jgi:diguanylate cyclase (GGDEF)-like protein
MKRNYYLKDTVIEEDGRRYRMEIAIDVTVQVQHDRALKKYKSNENMINEGVKIAMMGDSPENSMHLFLEFIGKSLKSDRVYIFEKNEEETFDNTYEWCAQGVTAEKDNLQGIPYSAVKLWLDAFQVKKEVIIKNLEDERETHPVIYDYLKPQNIDSLVVSPLTINNDIIGFYGVDNPPEDQLEDISNLLVIMGQFISSMITRRNLVSKLQNLSYFDQLTGLLNRHAMNEFLEGELREPSSVGVAYCDVMGLKSVNDTKGHEAGDLLLVRAADSVRQVFAGDWMFRVGGDEFLIIALGRDRNEFENKALLLDEKARINGATMAVGFVWTDAYKGNADELVSKADREMYLKKREYYKRLKENIS